MPSSGMQYAVCVSRGWIAAANPKFDGSPGVLKRQVVSPGSRQYTSSWTRMKRTPLVSGWASSLWMHVKTSGRSPPLTALSCAHVAPPSVLVYTPPTLIPTCILFGSFASIAIECRPMPPNPGTHFARDGWSSRLCTMDQLSPRSSLLKSAAGVATQYEKTLLGANEQRDFLRHGRSSLSPAR